MLRLYLCTDSSTGVYSVRHVPQNINYGHRDPVKTAGLDNGQEVYKFAVRTVPKCINEALAKAELQPEDISLYLLHQANQRIIDAVAKRLKQPADKFPVCLEECGNISAASVPVLLDRVNKDGKLKRGDKIVLAGFGAGLTWGAAVLVW